MESSAVRKRYPKFQTEITLLLALKNTCHQMESTNAVSDIQMILLVVNQTKTKVISVLKYTREGSKGLREDHCRLMISKLTTKMCWFAPTRRNSR